MIAFWGCINCFANYLTQYLMAGCWPVFSRLDCQVSVDLISKFLDLISKFSRLDFHMASSEMRALPLRFLFLSVKGACASRRMPLPRGPRFSGGEEGSALLPIAATGGVLRTPWFAKITRGPRRRRVRRTMIPHCGVMRMTPRGVYKSPVAYTVNDIIAQYRRSRMGTPVARFPAR